jgi:hypothetical protein
MARITDIVVYHPGHIQIFEDVKNFRFDESAEGDRRRIFFDWNCGRCDKLHHMTIFGSPYMVDDHEQHAVPPDPLTAAEKARLN